MNVDALTFYPVAVLYGISLIPDPTLQLAYFSQLTPVIAGSYLYWVLNIATRTEYQAYPI